MSERKFRALCKKYGYGVTKRRGRDEWVIYVGDREEVTEPEFVGTFEKAVEWLSRPSQ